MKDSYSPVGYEYREVIAEQIEKGNSGKVFFFNDEGQVDEKEGAILSCKEIQGEGIFIELGNKEQIRIDKIITLFGKPGAAYDRYDALGNVCFECTGGYEL